jgi:UDP-N-acetylglucosamine pyrophosphorylase
MIFYGIINIFSAGQSHTNSFNRLKNSGDYSKTYFNMKKKIAFLSQSLFLCVL